MYRKGHVGISMLFASIVIVVAPIRVALLITGIIAVTERLPDKDQVIPKISHREYSHTLLAGGVVATLGAAGVLLWTIAAGVRISDSLPEVFGVATAVGTPLRLAGVVWIGILLGFVSHMVGDMITVGTGGKGVQPIKPLSEWELPLGLCKASNKRWNKWLFISGQSVFLMVVCLQAVV